MYNRLPEDELSGSKHVEDIKQLKIKILIYEMCSSLVYIV
jgi:BRCT domain type II-containing protein